ncbi:hypothetical protein G7074_17115 [Pedobacter sp. HDW13]|uniref:hypothetical protein n=1 Tax=unclassified Pedobacter TaxID=2628915 RepID=UPI000F590E20|nr:MULTISPECIES: hypothetical protein [unclassified Pedobacter]QIL40830.1 hypothetical protein G7074_17115 [Pedobacter sp. HDW13]RQO71359.1 hypothetical protein DBR40_16215 [Pedobacter sp. KBW01]
MKNQFLLLALSVVLFSTSCKKNVIVEGTSTETPTNNTNVVEVSGEISANTTWSASKIYLLKGFVFVSGGATLTIEPGTIIKGDKASKGTLIITRGAKINATGTVDKPIVFTSALNAGARSQGDWGGVILLGKAPVNQGTDVKIEGGLVQPSGKDEKAYIFYGGTDVADNSGTMKYVRIEFAGIAYSVDNEINGLTMGGVGSGTTLDYIQIYRSGDDAFEWFGGTVNAKHLLAIGTWDDDFDTDFGYSGNIQFALAQRVATVADQSQSNGFESDNNATGTDQTPKTSAVFSNVTILGPIKASGGSYNANYYHGAQIRRNSSISILNSVISGFPIGVYVDDTKVITAGSTSTNFTSGSAVFANNLVYGSKTDISVSTAGVVTQVTDLLKLTSTFDGSKYASSLFVNPYIYGTDFAAAGAAGNADFTLVTGSAAATGAAFTNAKVSGAFFDKVDYKGAFGTTNWASGWAQVDAQTLAYTTPGAVK